MLVLAVSAAMGRTTPAHAATPVSADVVRMTLHNGLRVVIVRNALAPVVTTQITYLAGSCEATRGFPGTAHALEHMLFRGSKGLTEAQLDRITGEMGADSNAFTTADATRYYFSAPARFLDVLLHIESIRMRGATMANWRLEKGAIEQEVSMHLSRPDYSVYRKAREILYAGTDYAEDQLGTRPSFDKTTTAILRKFYDRWYQPGNAVLVIVGDIDPEMAATEVRKWFGPIPKGKVPPRPPVKLAPLKPETLTRTTTDPTGSVEFMYRLPGLMSEDAAAMRVLTDVLNNSRSTLSRLAAQGKVLSASASEESYSRGGILTLKAGFPKGSGGSKTATELERTIESIRQHGVAADLVEAAKRQERARFEFSRNDTYTEASAWSRALAWQGLDSPREALNDIERVTPAEVDRVARQYLQPDQRLTAILTPDTHGKSPAHGTGFGGTAKAAGNESLTVQLPSWANRALAGMHPPRWTLDPVRMKLSNGLTLIVQPETVSRTVTVVGHVDSNEALQAPAGQAGVGRLLDSLFGYGTATLDRAAFHKALDAIAATESAGTDFSLAVPSADFDRGMRLLADNELHPALPESAFEVQRKALAHTLAGELQSPQYKADRALAQGLLPAGDPALRQATPETVSDLSLADVRDYFARVYRPDMTTIVVVGDVTPAQARTEVEKTFGAWQATGPKPDVVPKPVSLNPPGYTVVANGYATQDQVQIGQMLALDVHDSARYALQLGNEILGANGGASRLMVEVRVNHGYAYYVDSGMQFGRSRSRFMIEYGSDPDKVAAADELVRQNLAAMRNALITPDELTNAKQALLRSIPLQVSSVDSIAHALLDWSRMGEPLDEPMVAARHYLALSPAQVQAAFRRYIKPDHLVQVVLGPTPKQH